METAFRKSLSPIAQKIVAILLIFAVFIFFVWATYTYVPVHRDSIPDVNWGFSVDWKGAFRPAALLMLSGHNPFEAGTYHNPPWALIPLMPVALLSPALGAAVMFVLNYMVYAFIAFRLGAKPLTMILFIFCPLVFVNGFNGNIDWLVTLGFLMPPQIGLFFVLMKPQIGIGLAVFWLIEAWRRGRLREVMRVFAPITTIFLLSFALYGLWPLNSTGMPDNVFNQSMWPLSIPIGLALLLHAIRTRKAGLSLTASPLLAPYLTIHSYAPALLGLEMNSLEMISALVALWVMRFFMMY